MAVDNDSVDDVIETGSFDLPEMLQSEDYSVQYFRPVWEPFNDAAHRAVSRYLDQLDLPKSSKKIEKYSLVVASLLYSIRKVVNVQQGRVSGEGVEAKPAYLGAALGHDNWTIYPLVGRDVAKRAINAFVEAGLLKKVEGSGKRHFYETENGRLAYEAVMTMWQVNASFHDDPDLEDARFIETGRPLVLVNVLETRNQKEHRERHKEARKRLSQADCARLFGDEYAASQARTVSCSPKIGQ